MLASHFKRKKGCFERPPPIAGVRKSVAALSQSNLGSYVTPSQETSAGLGRWILLAILVLAAILRVWGIGFGLPHLEARPDEMEVVSRAIRLLSGDLNPHFFHYPSLYFYLLGAVFAAWSGVSIVLGSSMLDFLAGAAVDPSGFVQVARYVTAVAGVATVYGVYRVGTRLQGQAGGLAAAALLSFSHLHVRESHFATTDITLSLFLVGAVYHLLGVAEKGTSRSYLWAGIFTGLAISTKYVGLILPGVLLVAHVAFHSRTPGNATWRQRVRAGIGDPRIWVFAVASAGAFLLTSPYAVLDWALFTNHFKFQLSHLSGGHGIDLGIGGIYHLRHTLPKGLGWPTFMAGVIGGGWALRRHPRRTAVLLAFPVLFYLSTLTSRTLFLRYMLPVIPFLCLTAGWWLVQWAPRPGRWWKWSGVAAVLFVASVSVADVVATNHRLSLADTRTQAANWLGQEVAGGASTVFQTGARWGWIQLPLTTDSLEVLRGAAARVRPTKSLERLRLFSLRQAEARLAESIGRTGGFKTVPYDPETGFGGGVIPEWIVVLRSPLEQYSAVPEGLEPRLQEEFEAVRTYQASIPGREGWYDQHDAFFLPFKRIRAVARPGPDVTIYRRITRLDSVSPPPENRRPPEEAP